MSTNNNKLIVLSLVGPSGAGKSTVLNSIKSRNNILEEKYMELNKYKLDNRLLISKWTYIDYWFNSIIQAKKQNVKLLVTDRCPYDTCAYVSNNSDELFKIISRSFDELKELGINIKTVLVTGEFQDLQSRIASRMKIEKERELYHEGNEEHNLKAFNFFKAKEGHWDYVINTTKMTKDIVEEKIKEIINKIN